MNDIKSNKKKIIIIAGIILLVIVVIMCLVLNNKPKQKHLSCQLSKSDVEYVKIDMDFDVYYNDEINEIVGTMVYNITDDGLKGQIDYLYSYLNNFFDAVIGESGIDVNVTKESSSIIVKYDIDYDKIDVDKISEDSVLPIKKDITKKMSINDFLESVESAGGSCVEKK